jgi:hypothetical protein
MPFPFVPGGVLLALAVLAGAMTVFGLALRAMDRAFAVGRRSVLPGLVSGLRNWTPPSPSADATDEPVETTFVELVDRRIPDAD